jgi:lysophospholipase L1-like esterase
LSRALMALLVGVVLITVACGNRDESEPTVPQELYISLGDSIAAGSGSSEPQASFPAIVAGDLGVELENLSVSGATTSDVLSNQIPRIAEVADGRAVGLITVSAGGNDLAALIPNSACVEDPVPSSCPLNDTLFNVAAGLGFIVDELRLMFPETPIVLLAYPNFFSNTGHPYEAPATRVLPDFARVVQGVAASHLRGNIAVAAPSFDGDGGALTHLLDEPSDPHPNDAGHEAIADAVLEAAQSIR